MGDYKTDGSYHAYEMPLLAVGFTLAHSFADSQAGQGTPDGFPELSEGGWAFRRAIKQWMKDNPAEWQGRECRIVRANGYYRDIHGPFVYEIWAKPKETD